MRKIITGILAVAILFMGLPCFTAGDLNHDKRVDLADAIVGVRALARTAEGSAVFGEKMKNAVSAVQLAAGLETRVVPVHDAGYFKSLDRHFLISSHDAIHFAGTFKGLAIIIHGFESMTPSSLFHPPRMA